MSRSLRLDAVPAAATVQDAGRSGFLHVAVPPSGPLDPTAHAAANLAVGNEPRAAAIEIPLGTLRCTAAARLRISIDGAPALDVAPGEAFTVATCARAVRYLAVEGGIDVPVLLGSRSTLLSAGWGGHEGRVLRAGDTLAIGASRDVAPPSAAVAPRSIAVPTVVDPPDPAVLRVTLGPHAGAFSRDAIAALTAATWCVSSRSDRVGTRLDGPALGRAEGDRGPPSPMLRGAVQITSDGTPIVLGPDHPVTGGYPVVVVLGRASQALLARLRPRHAVRFALETQ